MEIHQSDLSAFTRCAAAFSYQAAGLPRRQLSATAFGSVMHHATEVFESLRMAGVAYSEARETAIETFVHYWNPANIAAVCDPVSPDGWIARDSYNGLRARGITVLKGYTELVRDLMTEVLALEFAFRVPIAGTWDEDLGKEHELLGAIDKLEVKRIKRYETVNTADYKTGREYRFLRHNMQFTAYCYASTRPEFWLGANGEDGFGPERGAQLYERFADSARHAEWVDLKNIKIMDAGFRGPLDYQRFAIGVQQFAASVKAEIFPLTMVGEVCTYCDYRGVCAGTGVPADNHGDPSARSAL